MEKKNEEKKSKWAYDNRKIKKKKKELACRRALLNFFSFLKNMFLHAYSKNIKAFLNSQSFLYRYTLNKL